MAQTPSTLVNTPNSRELFKQYCLRRLGAPVLEINVDPDQVDDRVNDAIRYYWDYHFDGAQKTFFRYPVSAASYPDAVAEIDVISPGSGYSNTDTVVITAATGDSTGTGATANIVTDNDGAIVSVNITNNGSKYRLDPVVTVTSGTGSNAVLQGFKGGYFPVPDNIIGIMNIFDIGAGYNTNNLFNIRYQIALNDLYTLTSQSMVPYYMAMQHIQMLEQLLVGKQPLRYNRIANKLYLDIDWNKFNIGDFVIAEAYQCIDPDVYSKMWSDRWLQRYATALIKQQWGTNLSKFIGMNLPGGVQFNGSKIYDDATREIEKLEAEMIESYSEPPVMMIG